LLQHGDTPVTTRETLYNTTLTKAPETLLTTRRHFIKHGDTCYNTETLATNNGDTCYNIETLATNTETLTKWTHLLQQGDTCGKARRHFHEHYDT
jgi:hypothetical protein